jgi:hypothetical protein
MCKNKFPIEFFDNIKFQNDNVENVKLQDRYNENIRFQKKRECVISYLEKRDICFIENEDKSISVNNILFGNFEFELDFAFNKYDELDFALFHKCFKRKEYALNLYYEIKKKLENDGYTDPHSDFESITYICKDGTIHLTIVEKDDGYSVELGYVKIAD